MLRGPQLAARRALARAQPRLCIRELRRFAPTRSRSAGGTSPRSGVALAYCRAAAHPAARLGRVAPPATRAREARAARARPKRAMVRGASGAFVPGTACCRLRALARRRARSRPRPNAIDASVFERAAVDRSERDGCTFLYVGRLDPEKGLDTLLEAFRDVPGELVLVGAGERRRASSGRSPATACASRAQRTATSSSA